MKHPLWHLLVVAGGAIALFAAIKVKEWWDARSVVSHERGFEPPSVSVLALALMSTASAALHSAVSGEHFQEAFVFGAFFLVASVAQAGWAVAIVYRPRPSLLLAAAAGNAAVVVLWVVTRTVGLPIGPEPWHPETIGVIDLVCTALEVAVVVGAFVLLARTDAKIHQSGLMDPVAPG
ncbi:MAG TPA: hypothetical protein VGP92_15430 [Acidimicrobiia bacterium]|jgi:hypothetical protein|nr:hypothetical protein [Acidimicrobiia bacterium]